MAKRPQTAQTAVKAVNLVKHVLNDLNWVCNPFTEDFGIDLHVKVFEPEGERRALPWEFHVQVKGTTKLQRANGCILFTIDSAHLRDWNEAGLPVLFVLCDVLLNIGYWILVKDYVEMLDEDWEDRKTQTLRIPEGNLLTREGMLTVLSRIRRASFIHEAPGVIAYLETPREDGIYDQHNWLPAERHYQQPLEAPDTSLRDLALARCICCYNYFWIEESVTDGCDRILPGEDMPENLDFTAIYGPRAHEPAVYSCDSPDELCPFCTKGYGAFAQCQRCERYNVPRVQWLEDWDDPLIGRDEAENHCAACLDDLRALRRSKT